MKQKASHPNFSCYYEALDNKGHEGLDNKGLEYSF